MTKPTGKPRGRPATDKTKHCCACGKRVYSKNKSGYCRECALDPYAAREERKTREAQAK